MRLRFRRSDALLLLISCGLAALYVATAGGGFPLDDSWIHQTYGRNLAQTGQWAFVPGVPSAASTSPLYTVLLAVGYWLGVPYALWTHGLGALALAGAGMVGLRMAERLLPGQPRAAFVAGLALVTAWHLVWAAVSGMETMLFSFWTLALLALAWREADSPETGAWQRGALFGVVAGLATMTRPEGVMLAGLAGAGAALVLFRRGLTPVLVWSGASLVAFFIVLAPYLSYNIALTGGPLPDTAAAKQAENAPLLALPYPARYLNLLYPLVAGVQVVLVPGAVYYALRLPQKVRNRRELALYLLPVAWSLALVGLYAARLPAPYQHGRYVIPALPALILVGVVGMAWWLHAQRFRPIGRVVTRSLALSALATGAVFALVVGPGAYRQDVRIINEEMVAAARWIAVNLSPDELLAVHDIGAVGYFAPRPILDLAGLVSPEVVPIILEEEPLWALMRSRGARYLMALPDQIPGRSADDSRLCPIYSTGGQTARSIGEPNMTVYRLTWDGSCAPG